MNKANLKSYAPKARLDFIKAVTERANVLGISAAGMVPAEVRGDVALIDGREWPAKVAGQRDELIARIKRHGFEQTMDEVAYTWFNRFAALRYMEIHDYLGHGWRVLSSRDGGLPEILRHASEVTLPGLNSDRAREMQLAGNQDNELYKLLLVAQCNELSRVMPFLFEHIDDETELLLPENLLRTDSIVAKLVEQVPEEDWKEIEVIGWLYQFYISEKKDQVIGKVVKSEDIPAATQLFTPNWIVQYLVQNSVGRLWLMANPSSTLASQWPYYIQPAQQTPEVQAQLDALIQTRIREDGETLNPETITVLDPACGSGHILVVAYDVLKAIYLERGYQPRSIPRLILEKNLYGLDIDNRAAQLAAFALMMKARADDRRLFNEPPTLNVLSLMGSKGLSADELASHLVPFGLQSPAIGALLNSFAEAKTIGSLIQIPEALSSALAAMTNGARRAILDGDLYARQAAKELLPMLWQALLLSMRFDAVVANPPYMGARWFNKSLKEYTSATFDGFERDLFSAFIARSFALARDSGSIAIMTSFVWMFIGSFARMRQVVINEKTITSLVQLEYDAFEEAKAHICAFVVDNSGHADYSGSYVRLTDFRGAENQGPKTLEAISNRECGWLYESSTRRFLDIPGAPIAYWLSDKSISHFANCKPLSYYSDGKSGMSSCNSALFLRKWYEVSSDITTWNVAGHAEAASSGATWFPYNKGGGSRRWYGYNDTLINWESDGAEIKQFVVNNPNDPDTTHWSRRLFNLECFFKPGITWSAITSASFAVRTIEDSGVIPGTGSKTLYDFAPKLDHASILGYLNSKVCDYYLKAFSPTLNFEAGDVGKLPILVLSPEAQAKARQIVQELVTISKQDWNDFETSASFKRLSFVPMAVGAGSIAVDWLSWSADRERVRTRYRALEKENNALFAEVYGMQAEVSVEVQDAEISLAQPDRNDDCRRLISYAIGCAMGRYSLDQPGLIYANARNLGFDPVRYGKSLQADADAIIPITDEAWFEDDSASRVNQFVTAVWGAASLGANMAWLAESVGTKGSETPDETIRRYLADKFYKDHVQTYKKRPIYWLFFSGKQGAFQALVYLHRYNEGTLARMRAEYVVPLIAKVQSRLDMLDRDVAAAPSAAARTKLQKQIELLRRKHLELLGYDEKLRHYADMRITLDLDDGVKVNYAKFGDLVAESKAITGGSDE